MAWSVSLHPDFVPEFQRLEETVQDELLAISELLRLFGPSLKRPRSDTLSGSAHANMKELRFGDGVWRVAYAFDPQRKAILLVAGDKSGISQKRFYAALIAKADQRFDGHLASTGAKEKRT